MGIRWDSALARAVATELDRELRGARLRAVLVDEDERDFRLYFRDRTLVFRLGVERGHVLALEVTEPPEDARRLAARVLGVSAPPDDRRLDFALKRERGGALAGISVSLQPARPGAVAWEGDPSREVARLGPGVSAGVSAGVSGRVSGRVSGGAPPEREGATDPVPLARWREIMADAGPDAAQRRRLLLKRVAWTSPVNVDCLVGGGDLVGEGDADESVGHALWLRIRDGGEGHPVLLTGGDGPPQPYPLPLPGVPSTPSATLLDAMAASADATGADRVGLAHSPATLAALAGEVRRCGRALGSLERELAESRDPAGLRGLGDLILAHYAVIPSGADRVSLPGFEGGPVEVELDPSLKPHENADVYYRRAKRNDRAREVLPERIAGARKSLAELEDLLRRAHSGEADPAELLAAVPARTTEDPDTGEVRSLPYRTFTSSGGIEIRVGRGSKWNDDLTFRHSRPSDIWLHARHSAGAHVILRWEGKDAPPARDIGEAAVLAAVHSKARGAGTAAVDWTRRKYVRKPRNSPPGTVLPERVKTLFVAPDAEVVERLRNGP